jgi:uncharacterized protein
MRLELEKLDRGGEFAQAYGPEDLSLEDRDLRLVEPVEVRGRVQRKGAEVQVSGTLMTKVEAPCARCLKPVAIPISTEFSERFVTAVRWRSEEEHELAPEDLNLALFDGEGIGLDQLVREEILLATPAQIFCRDDCKGLCAVCGGDRNVSDCACESASVDSRWEKLKDLSF